MRFRVTVMIIPLEGDGEPAKSCWELEALNHNDAIADALKTLRAMEDTHPSQDHRLLCGADEGLTVIVQPLPEQDGDQPFYWKDIPRPQIDDRDPYGNLQRAMLRSRHGDTSGLTENASSQKWLREHPEFEMEYLIELQRLEREALAQKLKAQDTKNSINGTAL